MSFIPCPFWWYYRYPQMALLPGIKNRINRSVLSASLSILFFVASFKSTLIDKDNVGVVYNECASGAVRWPRACANYGSSDLQKNDKVGDSRSRPNRSDLSCRQMGNQYQCGTGKSCIVNRY